MELKHSFALIDGISYYRGQVAITSASLAEGAEWSAVMLNSKGFD